MLTISKKGFKWDLFTAQSFIHCSYCSCRTFSIGYLYNKSLEVIASLKVENQICIANTNAPKKIIDKQNATLKAIEVKGTLVDLGLLRFCKRLKLRGRASCP
ncbi:MAG: hypothetical protein K2I71_00150 [Helicobacter sp.]|nr:hypothetical protein [Helicobacter sp.]